MLFKFCFVHKGDGKLLKTRFDEIFAATKYIKALDILKKIRLEKTHIIKQVEIEKRHLENYKTHAQKLSSELEVCTQKRENALAKKDELDEKLKPIQAEIDKYLMEENKIFQIKNEMDKIKNEKDLLAKQMKEIIVNVQDCMFMGTEEELREIIENFKTTTIQMLKDEEGETREKHESFNEQLKALNSKRTKFHLEVGQIEAKMKILTGKKKDLADLARKACKLIKLDVNELFSESDVNSFDHQLLNRKLVEYSEKSEAKLVALEKTAKNEEDSLQNELNEQRDSKSKLDQNILIKQESTQKAKKQLDLLNAELHQVFYFIY